METPVAAELAEVHFLKEQLLRVFLQVTPACSEVDLLEFVAQMMQESSEIHMGSTLAEKKQLYLHFQICQHFLTLRQDKTAIVTLSYSKHQTFRYTGLQVQYKQTRSRQNQSFHSQSHKSDCGRSTDVYFHNTLCSGFFSCPSHHVHLVSTSKE